MKKNSTSLSAVNNEFRSLSETVYEKIREAILAKELEPGERVSERMLVDKLGVSSTTVKRALQQLQAEGLVEIQPRKGTYVVESFPAMEENTVMRASLEGLAARFAASKATEDDLKEMRHQLEEMRRRTEIDTQQNISKANARFHHLVHRASYNPYVGRLIDVLRNFDRDLRHQALSDHDEAVRGLKDHISVFEAIEARDGDLAEERMRRHILRTLEFVKTGMKKGGKAETP
ncbi:GntR family transcriptional regulator [Marispirochaeta sp.]|uniref:GntR family transcriptional regulator n=1 Tax=Marispirochaeta sp. TaxID=2038653 RepID=UPI0029C86D90|nr:GntR family transcriptional regulator [Marispirochaeta sp.]